MKKVLLVKTSSLGDVIHTLPALTDAMSALGDIQFDWLVEERFTQLPSWHPAVNQVIPMAWRRWRKSLFKKATRDEIQQLQKTLQNQGEYDLILDAQGLLKSGIASCLAKGKRAGYDRHSSREGWSSLFYQECFAVSREQHAIDRNRQLFAKALRYDLPDTVANYGLDRSRWQRDRAQPTLLFFFATTWKTKHWPESYWQDLAKQCIQAGYAVRLGWGSPAEKAGAERIQSACSEAQLLPDLDLQGLIGEIASAAGVVGVDTGLLHLTAALNVPSVALYGPTDAHLTGTQGQNQINLFSTFSCAPCLSKDCTFKGDAPVFPACFAEIEPTRVFSALSERMKMPQS